MSETEPQNQVDWAMGLLSRQGRNPQGTNLVGVVAWALAEGGHWANEAHFNPLNTTYDLPPCTSINSVGVKAYESWEQGFQATIATLNLHYYTEVVAAMGTVDPYALAKAVAASPWGTGDFSGVIPRAKAMVAGDVASQPEGSTPQPAPRPVVVPPYPGRYLKVTDPYMEGSDVHQWQTRMWQRGWTKLAVDGIYGPQTEAVCKAFQEQKNLAVDGIVGPQTWNAAWTEPITIP